MHRARRLNVAVLLGAVVAMTLSMAVAGASGASTKKSDNGIPAAEKVIASLTKRPTSIGITVPIKKPIPKNETVDFLVCPITDCTILEPVDKAAVKVLGWKANFINDGLTPEALDNAMNLAISQHPGAIFVGGFARSEMNSEIAKAKADHIPIFDSFVADKPGNGITAVTVGTPSTLIGGGHIADWVLAKKGKSANVLFVTSSTFPDVIVRQQGFTDQYKKLCPSCKMTVLNAPASTFGTTLPGSIVAKLKSDPSINYVVAGEPDAIIGLPQAMSSAGLQTPIVSGYVDPTGIAYLRDHTQLQALVEHGSALAQWESVDAFARYLTGQSVKPDEGSMPSWVITPAIAAHFHRPYIQEANYEAQFKKLWGIK